MKYRTLGKSGLKVSEIGLGGVTFGRSAGEQESVSIVHHAIDLGINFIDTADHYNEGRSEEFVGKAVKGRRSEVIIATKFGLPVADGINERGASRHHILKAIEASLDRLNTDYIDLYYIHVPDPATPIEETLRTMDSLVRSGKVRYIGCCNFSAWQLCESLWTSRTNNLEPFVIVQLQYNLLERWIESELVPCCQAYGVGIIPWAPLARGFLTGRYHRGEVPPSGSRLTDPRYRSKGVLTETNYDKLGRLQAFALERGRGVGELAIGWLLSHTLIPSVIAGATKPEQVSANVAAADWTLTAQEMALLD